MTDVFIAAAGTGGHIYPGIAVAQQILKHQPNASIEFIGSELGMEKTIIPRYGFKLNLLPALPVKGVSLIRKLIFMFQLPWILFASFSFLLKHRPKVCFGTGGYASAIPLVTAWILRIPVLIFESNAKPGLTNRILAKKSRNVFLQFEEAAPRMGLTRFDVVTMPTRESSTNQKANSFAFPKKESGRLHCVILGGSQGARFVNQVIASVADKLVNELRLTLIHQTGEKNFDSVAKAHRASAPEVQAHWRPVAYIENIQEAYGWADFLICRAGSSTLAEIQHFGVPSILIPFPFATDNHQELNAKALVDKGMALMIIEKKLEAELMPTLRKINQHQLSLMKAAILKHQPRSDSSHKITQQILSYL